MQLSMTGFNRRPRGAVRAAGRRLLAASTAIAVAGALGGTVAAFSASASTKSTKPTWTIGWTGDLSGPLAAFGKSDLVGNRAYFTYADKSGGIDGHNVKLVYLDTATTDARGKTNVTQLIEADHVITVSGLISSTVCHAVAPLALSHKVPMFCQAAPSTVLKPLNPYMFSTASIQVAEAAPMLNFTKKLLGHGPKVRAAVIGVNSLDTTDFVHAVANAAKKAGDTVVATDLVPLTATTVSAQAAAIAAAHPSAVYTGLPAPLLESFDKELRADKINAPIISFTVGLTYAIMKSLNDPNLYQLDEFAIVLPGSTAASQAIHAFGDIGVKGAANINTVVNMLGYMQGLMIGTALKKCGSSCTPEKLAKVASRISVNAPGVGRFGFTQTNHYGIKSYTMYRWSKGKPVAVAKNLKPGSITA